MRGPRLEPDASGRLRLVTGEAGPPRAVLVASHRWRSTLAGRPRLLAAAWEGRGATRFGWPRGGAWIDLETQSPPEQAVLIPAALAVLEALGRAGAEIGARVLVAGAGLDAALRRAAVEDCGGRPQAEIPGGGDRVGLLVAGDADASGLATQLRGVADGGRAVVLGEPGEMPGFDFYPDVHRRGLALHVVPPLPDGEAATRLLARGRARLERLVASVAAAAPEGFRRTGGAWDGELETVPAGWTIHIKEG